MNAIQTALKQIDILALNFAHSVAKDKARKAVRAGFDHPYARSLMGYMVQWAPDDVAAAAAYFSLAGSESKRSHIQWRNAAVLARWCRRYRPGEWPTIRRQLSDPWNVGPRVVGEPIREQV